MEKRGKCVIFSAPSGAGKTTIVHSLLNEDLGLEFSISATSRSPRPNEINGKDYHFLHPDEFRLRVKNEEFVEWEEVYRDNFYGTLKSEIERIWSNGKAVIFDVDVVGGLNLKKAFGDKALAVFVQPPSYEELEKRLRYRNTETEDKIRQRLDKAKIELERAPEFDQVVVNDELADAITASRKLVQEFLAK